MSQLKQMVWMYENKLRSWITITEERYNDLLEAVPPLRQSESSFIYGEAVLFHVYFICRKVDDKYQYLLGTLKEWGEGITSNNDPDNTGTNS